MLNHFKDLRPNCETLLNENNFWALDVVHIEKELKILSYNEKSIDENFIEYFIRVKMNEK